MEKKFVWVGLGVLGLVLLMGVVGFFVIRANQSFHGSVIDPPSQAADFTLTDQSGREVRLSDYRGRYVLMFFGYTHCPDECPATMAILKQVRIRLGDQADKVQVIFVSTDPGRDTQQAVGDFVNRFDPSFIGLTGTQAELQPVWAEYGVTVLDGGETHSTFVYLIDPQGNMRLTYPNVATPDDIVGDLQILFKNQ